MSSASPLSPRLLVVGTTNDGKLAEYRTLLASLGVEVRSLRDYPSPPVIVEDADTFAGNAIKKAEGLCRALGETVLSDDSGLEVDALGGAPGVHSARYAGEPQNSAANIAKLLQALQSVAADSRGARFRCVIALAQVGRPTVTVEGTCEGRITLEPRGSGGFGYDPVFLDPQSGLTFAELGAERKNRLSHRARALQLLRKQLLEALS